jgi:hypothetical protein
MSGSGEHPQGLVPSTQLSYIAFPAIADSGASYPNLMLSPSRPD